MPNNQQRPNRRYNNDHRSNQSRPRRQPAAPVQVEVGQRFPLTIKRMGINGEGIGYYKKMAVFVPGAITDEVVVVEVTVVHPRYLRAKIRKIRDASPDRVEPRDTYAGNVGGFELEHLAYPAQLEFKRDIVVQSLEKYQPRGFQDYELRPTLGMKDPYSYRNKAQFQIRMIDGHVAAGLYKEGTHELVDLETCSVQDPRTMTVMRAMVKILEELEVPIYDEDAKSGIVKTLVVRAAMHTDDLQLTIITNSKKLPKKRELLEAIAVQLPEVTSVMQNINPGETSLIWGDDTVHLAGESFIVEKLNDLEFKLSARSFFQLNTAQTQVLYDEGLKALDLGDNENVVDAYAGVGTIGLTVAHASKEVRGMEVIPEAVADANENAKLNDITNASYEVGTAEDLLPVWMSNGFHPDAIIVDPPRTGLDDMLIDAILTAAPEDFVYISCNPSTMARDLVKLAEGYRVKYIQSVDMMPQTARCEAVVKLEKR